MKKDDDIVFELEEGLELTPKQLEALASYIKAESDDEKKYLEYDIENKKLGVDIFKTVLGASVTVGGTLLAAKELRDVTIFEETGTYTTSSGKGFVKYLINTFFKFDKKN